MKHFQSLVTSALAIVLGSCVAPESVGAPWFLEQDGYWHTHHGFFLPVASGSVGTGRRVHFPRRGSNNVYLDFGDGTDREFESFVTDAIRRKVKSLGYRLTDQEHADYVLWATVRSAEPLDQGAQPLEGLGTITGGAPEGTIPVDFMESATAHFLSKTALGGPMFLERWFGASEEECWALVIDVQLGQRLDEPAGLLSERRFIAVARSLQLGSQRMNDDQHIVDALTDCLLERLSRTLPPHRRWM